MSARRVFNDSVVPLEADGLIPNGLMVNAVTEDHSHESMELLFSLEIPADKQKELEGRVASGEVVPADELHADYSPTKVEADALAAWLTSEGFTITHRSASNSAVYASATGSQIEKTLQVHLARVTRNGVTWTAARDAPSLPEEVAGSVHAIIGLQPYRHMAKHLRRCLPAVQADGVTGAAAIKNGPPYMVPEIKKAYGADALSVDGSGQTIAILIDTFPDINDLNLFWQNNGLNVTEAQVVNVNVTGGQMPPTEGEETLDVSWASGMAPGADIRVYTTGSLQFVAMDKALDAIIADLPSQPGMRQLSMSLGLGETYFGGPKGEVAIQHAKFLRLAASGVNVFVSSGDAGSNPDQTGHSASGPLQAEYESSDPAVIGVGGTTMTLQADGTVASETAWNSGGGGQSIYFSRPTWQTGHGVPAGKHRLVPDVSLTADPNTGAYLVLQGKVQQIGGTSWSAPMWAGICALINEARLTAGKPALGFLNPQLYPLAGTACFRDITSGSNGKYSAGAGYDMVTGLGVPNVAELINQLS